MTQVAIDFGTSNTVIARYNETLERAETLEIPGITAKASYRLSASDPEHVVHMIPSMIHYSQTETLIGKQVLSRGLAEHDDTFRWMKRSIARRVSKRKKTAQGHIAPDQAGADYLSLVLQYASNKISLTDDEFTFTAPVEAFEDFQDWIMRVAERAGIRRLRLRDEPTACVFAHHGAARHDEKFLVFDFGGGTLDVSAVRLDTQPGQNKKAVQLGQAGCDLGGMDIDQWLAEDFCERHRMSAREKQDLNALILRQAEAVKIALSNPNETDATLSVASDAGSIARAYRTTYTRECDDCRRGRVSRPDSAAEGCLGCLLLRNDFAKKVRETIERALENAAVKVQMRRSDLTRVLVTGGTSLVPLSRRVLSEYFDGKLALDHPFDTVVRGACSGVVDPILQHDYSIESYNREKKAYEFLPLFKTGTEYPTQPDAVKFWGKGAYDGMTRIGIQIFEVSQVKRLALAAEALVDESGALRGKSRVASDYEYICLNTDNPTFIVCDPPYNTQRDCKRFLCKFQVDGHRRLLVTVLDNLSGRTLLENHPVVRL